MVDATISRARAAIWHAWAAPDPAAAGGAGLRVVGHFEISPRASAFVTGIILRVDGGFMAMTI